MHQTRNARQQWFAWGLIVGLCGLLFMDRADAAAPAYQYSIDDPSPGIVFDRKTGLHWERSPVRKQLSWIDANTRCSNMGGSWHLAEINQLQTLVDVRATLPPMVDTTAFPNTVSDVYWAKTMDVALDGGTSTFAWSVDFSTGASASHPSDLAMAYSWCVY